MPTRHTFQCPPIEDFVTRWLFQCGASVDPWAGNSRLATVTNDLNPNSPAQHHLEANGFLQMAWEVYGPVFALGFFDPPYSPRQLRECYQGVGRPVTQQDTQARTWARWKDGLGRLIRPGGVVLCFGWNTNGLGHKRGFTLEEVLIVAHGGAHNDTICTAERKIA